MKAKAAAFSTKGIRERNEDSYLLDGEIGGTGTDDSMSVCESDGDCLFFAVADGMGGHSAGDVASRFVLTKVKEAAESGELGAVRALEEKLHEIHKQLLERGRADGTENMGSTFVALCLGGTFSGFCNVGDSRIYRYRKGFIQQLSHDDSLSEILENAPKNIVTNAMGAGLPEVSVESRFSEMLAAPGDIFLLCSDGVHGHVTADDLEDILGNEEKLSDQAKRIVDTALDNGSDDNSTALLVKIEKGE